jgi:glutamine amidotransferase
MSQTIAVVDFGYCNIGSITRALEELGAHPVATHSRRQIEDADKVVLPGVGSFSAAMHSLLKMNLTDAIVENVADRGKPFLGICLGMQLMADCGLEGGQECQGLGLVSGRVEKMIPTDSSERIPHMGWNNVDLAFETPIFNGIPSGQDFYFVHSYHVDMQNKDRVIASTPFAGGIASSILGCHEQVWGVQYNPEKSQKIGMKLLQNFVGV